MWKPYPADDPIDGLVQFLSNSDAEGTLAWSIDARGGQRGIHVLSGDLDEQSVSNKEPECFFSFQPVGRDSLPVLAEQFIRGDELHLHYPQRDGSFGLRLVLQPIQMTANNLVLEATLSIETSLLDSRPMVDVVASAIKVRSLSAGNDGVRRGQGGAPPISVCERRDDSVAVLLGPHDSPFTTDRCSDQALRLRLFGDFLEKGVIRKARPWLVIRRDDSSISDSELQGWWAELNESPLPLTP